MHVPTYVTAQICNQHMSPFRPASQFAAGVGGRREEGVSVHGHRPLPRQGVRYEQHFIFSRFVLFYLLPAI